MPLLPYLPTPTHCYMNVVRRNIPNAITCLNILAGSIAIVFAFHSEQIFGSLSGRAWACIFIGIAAVADFCDGMAARMLQAYSDMGKELDSLCDLVSFGVAPGMLLWNAITHGSTSGWMSWIALLIPVAGALRLAKFNVDTRQSHSFIGLPIPANAIFWIGYLYMSLSLPQLYAPGVLIPIVLIECWLMLSELPIFSLKVKNLGWKGNQHRWALVGSAAVLVAMLGVGGLMWLIVEYVLLSLLPSTRKS